MPSRPSENAKLPDKINTRLKIVFEEIEDISNNADTFITSEIGKTFSFEYVHSSPTPILSSYERAQQVSFVTSYEHLPELYELTFIEKEGKYWIENYHYLRHILNDYRTIIMNTKDSIYYKKIHSFCHLKLANVDSGKGLGIRVFNSNGEDVTALFNEKLDQNIKAISYVIKQCDYKYLYNGILQHSDSKYSERYLEDYYSGEINYILIKHAKLLHYIKDCLVWHYVILNQLTFPRLGSL